MLVALLTLACLIGLLAAVCIGLHAITQALHRIEHEIIWLRKEQRAGLGVEASDRDGYACGGYLEELAKDAREWREAKRRAEYERDAPF